MDIETAKQRRRMGLQLARQHGVTVGRPTARQHDEQIARLLYAGYSMNKIAHELRISRTVVRRVRVERC